MAKVFLVEDNNLISNAVQEYFTISGLEVEVFDRVDLVRQALKHQEPDLIILDVMLPDGNGFLFAKELRKKTTVPVLFLTAREEESDRIMGFEVGGDDYVVKPFSTKELLLRVKALLRRSNGSPDAPAAEAAGKAEWLLGDHCLQIDYQARKVFIDDQEASLTASEWNLLTYLASRPEQAVSRDILLGECLGYLYSGSERTIDTHIANLRNRLGEGEWIETIRGFGYRFAGCEAEA
jgi:DNA-binding response OmpR family regulator